MSHLSNDLVSRFSNLCPQVWDCVSTAVAEAAGAPVTVSDPLTLATDVADLYAEMSSPKLIVQFAYSNLPDSLQCVLINRETVANMFESFTGKPAESVDDALVSDLRPVIEAIVQGMCQAASEAKGEQIVAAGLTIRLQIFAFPPNMQNAQQLIRTNVGITAEGLNGSMTWLVDEALANMLCGVDSSEEGEANQSGDLGFGQATATDRGHGAPQIVGLEDTGIDLLMDIPLEVTVELGRVRMVVRDVVELGSGSIVEIDKAAGEPVDVMVNNRLVARGEVVVIEDNFGVRITEILSPSDRLAKLNEVA